MIKTSFLNCLLPLLCLVSVASAQYAGWQQTGSLVILTTPEGADLPTGAEVAGFPLLVRLEPDWFDFRKAQPNGEDVRFSSGGVALSYQIDTWDRNKGASIWVKVPKIKGNERQEIKLHWGKPNAVSESKGSEVFGADNGFVSVLHMDQAMQDELGALTLKDMGTNASEGVVGEARQLYPGKGILGGDHIKNYPFGDGAFTSEAWFRPQVAGTTIFYWGRYATRLNGKTGDGNEVSLNIGAPASIGWASDGPGGAGGESVPVLGQWNHVAATYENGVSKIYFNGKLDGTRTHKAAMSIVQDIVVSIGGMRGSDFRYFGAIDEVRVSRVARSAEWMKLQYENQRPLQTLVGPLVQPGSGFELSQQEITLLEGQSATVTVKAGGAQKIYWSMVNEGVETLAAVDRFSFTLPAGRVTANTTRTLRCKAVFADGVKTKDIPVTIKEDLPEPIVTMKAPSTWNGRDPIEVVPTVSNLQSLFKKQVGDLKTRWTVSGGAVIKKTVGGSTAAGGGLPWIHTTPGNLLLQRSQFTGKIAITATFNNGGADTVVSTTIQVTEPKTDAWVQRVPDKNEQPEENQFYARDDQNEGTLFYHGTLEQPAESVFLKLYADEKLIKTETAKPNAENVYALSVKLKPGLIKYKVEFGSGDKVLRTVNNLICGDAYIIDGQSNAEATGPNNGPNEDAPSPVADWVRSYGNQHQGTTKGGWGNAVRTHIWGKPNYGDHQIGTWGMVLANGLVEKYHIPICIINSAYGGTPIYLHQRNPENHFDTSGEFYKSPYKIYGGLLNRVTAARLTHGIRGILWHQGENDQGSGAPTGDHNWKSYQEYFVAMAGAWKQDFPNVRNYYIYQIWPSGCNMGGSPAGDMLLDVQRTLPNLFSNMRIMSTLGIVSGSSGRGLCHFDTEGYAQIAKLMSPVIEQDHYGLERKQIMTAPNLKRASFTTPAKDEISLEFDQPMIWQDECKAWIELDRTPVAITSGKVSGNTITLKLQAPSEAKTMGYINGGKWDGKPDKLLYGINGIAALTFSAVALGMK